MMTFIVPLSLWRYSQLVTHTGSRTKKSGGCTFPSSLHKRHTTCLLINRGLRTSNIHYESSPIDSTRIYYWPSPCNNEIVLRIENINNILLFFRWSKTFTFTFLNWRKEELTVSNVGVGLRSPPSELETLRTESGRQEVLRPGLPFHSGQKSLRDSVWLITTGRRGSPRKITIATEVPV